MVQIKTHVDNETPKATESKGSQSKRLPRKYIAPQQGFFRETDDASDVAVSDPAPIDVELDKSAPYEDTDKVFLTELRDKLATLKKRVAVLVEQIQQLSTVKRKAALADLESALETLLLKYHLPSDGLEEEPSALSKELDVRARQAVAAVENPACFAFHEPIVDVVMVGEHYHRVCSAYRVGVQPRPQDFLCQMLGRHISVYGPNLSAEPFE